MFYKTLSRAVPVFLILSLVELPALRASAQELAEQPTKIQETRRTAASTPAGGTAKAEDKPTQDAESTAKEVKAGPCATVEASDDEEKSVTLATGTEPEEDDPAVDFYENIFKIKSVTGGGLGPAGFLKGAKTESQDHSVLSALIAISEKRQKTAMQPTASQGGGPATTPVERLGKGEATEDICLRVPLSKKASEAAADEKRGKAEKVEPKSGDGTESFPPPDNP